MTRFNNADFPIRTERSFEWLGIKAPGFRTLWLPDGTLFLPTTIYFGYKLENNKASLNTMSKELYAIREFLVFLANNNLPWYRADDEALYRWREVQLEEIEEISGHQVERKIAWVFDFYRQIPTAWPLDDEGEPRRSFVGNSNPRQGISFPITTKTFVEDGVTHTVWSGHRFVKGESPDFTVPDKDQIEKILSALRVSDIREGDREREPRLLVSERNWAIGRATTGAGLRAMEVGRVRMKWFTEMLRLEGLFNKLPDHLREVRTVSELAGDPASQAVVRQALNDLQRKKRRSFLFLHVVGKRNRQRKAYVLIDAVHDLLTYIWDVRPRHVRILRERSPDGLPGDTIFLSLSSRERIETGKTHALSAGAVSDILKEGFTNAGVEGSGHDLRKFYATDISVKILSDAMEVFGFQVTDAVLSTVLTRVKEALGHSRIDTTVEHYVNLARLHYYALQSRLKREILYKIWALLLERQFDLSDRKIVICHQFIDSLSQLPEDSPMLKIVEGLLLDPRMWPDDWKPPTPPPPVVRLVT
jgi:integrase